MGLRRHSNVFRKFLMVSETSQGVSGSFSGFSGGLEEFSATFKEGSQGRFRESQRFSGVSVVFWMASGRFLD